jgi:glycosyltransferase involved in cell wall biosynthesis
VRPSPQQLDRLRGRVAVVIPAYRESAGIAAVVRSVPEQTCGISTVTLVVDDGSPDATGAEAEAAGAVVARLAENRGQGAALRVGFEWARLADARVVVTMDGDGQHLAEELHRLVRPIVEDGFDLVTGSRVLGDAAPNEVARRAGIVFFARVLSLIARRRITDPANGFRAVRTALLARLVLNEDRFANAEFLIEAAKAGARATEVPVTVAARAHGRSHKGNAFRYGFGFTSAILRTWLRRSGTSRRSVRRRGEAARRVRARRAGPRRALRSARGTPRSTAGWCRARRGAGRTRATRRSRR